MIDKWLEEAKKGNCLPEHDVRELCEKIKEILIESNKKTLKKLYDLLDNAYNTGNGETSNIVVACISAAVCKDEDLKVKALEFLDEDKHLKNSVNAFIPVLLKDKKLAEAFKI